MSDYVPEVGDIVNVTLRDAEVAEVEVTPTGTRFHLDHSDIPRLYVYRSGLGTAGRHDFELVKAAEPPKPELPTATHSVVRFNDERTTWQRQWDGDWISSNGIKGGDGFLRSSRIPFTVLFDPDKSA